MCTYDINCVDSKGGGGGFYEITAVAVARLLLNALMFTVGENELKTTVSPTAPRHNPRRPLGGFLLPIKTPATCPCRDEHRSGGPCVCVCVVRVAITRGGSSFTDGDRTRYR